MTEMEYKKISFITVIKVITKLNPSIYRQIYVRNSDGTLDKLNILKCELIDFKDKEFWIYKQTNQCIDDYLTETWI